MRARPTQRIADDIACHRCGYNLRTLSRTGRCPECGERVTVSLRRRRERAFRAGFAAYFGLVCLCYVAPVLAHLLPAPEQLEQAVSLGCLVAAVGLSLAGFVWSAYSPRARGSLAVFLTTLAAYVYFGWAAFLTV